MITRSLIKTAAMTSMIALLPLGFSTSSDAKVKIKIKPQTHVNVNVKPKIKVAPKVKLKAAKVRIKIKPKHRQVETDPTSNENTVSQVASTKPTVNAQPRRKKVGHELVIASLGNGDTFEVAVPTPRPNQQPQIPADKLVSELDELGQARAAAEAARILDELKEVAALGKLRDAATSNPGLGEFDHNDTGSSNSDILGAPNTGDRDGMFGNYKGPGADEFAELENTHGSGPANSGHNSHLDALNAYYDIHNSIDTGIAGVAGSRRHDTISGGSRNAILRNWHPSTTVPGQLERNDTYFFDDGRREVHWIAYGNGGVSVAMTDYDENNNIIGEIYIPSSLSNDEAADRTYDPPIDPLNPPLDGKDTVSGDAGSDGTKADLTKRYDPDSGHGGTSPFPWINEREKPTTDITTASNGKTPGAMPQDPHADQVNNRNVQASVTTNDLLETWDEDSRRRGTPQPIDLCVHSEC